MKWELISNQHSSLQEYRLTENNMVKVVLKYNPRHQSARLTNGIHQRLFFLENVNALGGKTIFRNEYGMEIGFTATGKWANSEGFIIIDTKKYFYQLQQNIRSSELILFSNNPQQPLVRCSISQDSGIFPIVNKQNTNSCLLLSLGWYSSLSVEKETEREYAPH